MFRIIGGIKMQKKLFVALTAVATLMLAGCGNTQQPQKEYPALDPALGGEKVADFSQGEAEEFFATDGYSNGDPFNAVWKKGNVSYSDGKAKIVIKNEETPSGGRNYEYTAGELRSHKLYGYGDFQVRMKPVKVEGTVSTFFTYTGQYDVVGGVPHKHDEIDIEFLGKDTTKVQFNYFVGGVGGHEYMYDLGFDAAEGFHDYGFRWEENKISWVVDGKTAYVVEGSASNPLPSQQGRILTSFWPSVPSGWAGNFAGATNDAVEYEWIKSSADTIYADGEEPVPPFDENIDWAEVGASDLDYWDGSGGKYTLANNDGVETVTYESAGGWACLGSYVGDFAGDAEAVNITLKNNSNSTSQIKVDIQGTTKVGETTAINESAYADGHNEVSTDTTWGGSKIELLAGEEAQFVIKFDQTTSRGAITNVAFFLDSLQADDIAHAGGNITIKDVKFAKLDGTPVVKPAPQPGPGPEPSGDEFDWDSVTATALEFWASSPSIYTFENNNTTAVTVNYVDATGYACIGAANANTIADANNTLKISLRNNSEHVAHIRMDVQVAENTSAITGFEINAEHQESKLENGSAFLDLAVNEAVDLIVTYDATQGVDNVMFFVDSMASATSGSVTISNAKFATIEEEEPAEIDWDTIDATALEFWASSTEIYAFESNNSTAVTVNYTNAAGYACIGAGGVGALVDAKTTAKVTLRNNGDHVVKIRMDVQVTGGTSSISSAQAAGHNELRVSDGSAFLDLAVNEAVDLVVKYDATLGVTNVMFFIDSMSDTPASGSVTISNFKLA